MKMQKKLTQSTVRILFMKKNEETGQVELVKADLHLDGKFSQRKFNKAVKEKGIHAPIIESVRTFDTVYECELEDFLKIATEVKTDEVYG